jgi:hypothetical protein
MGITRSMIRETGWAALLTLMLLTSTALAFFVLPQAIVSPHDLQATLTIPPGSRPPQAPSATDLIQARNGVRTASVALLAGLGAAFATGFAARTYYLSRQSQLDLRYSTSIGQLDSEQISIKVSALAELGRIARQCPSRHRQVMSVLAAFIRGYERADHEDAAPPTLQTACDELVGRNPKRDGELRLDLTGADLRQVNLDGAPLRGAILRSTKLRGAFLRSADLREADFANARAESTRFDASRLDDAVFDGTNLTAATLDRAKGSRTSFRDVTFVDTFMRETDLVGCPGLHHGDGSMRGGVIVDKPAPSQARQTT